MEVLSPGMQDAVGCSFFTGREEGLGWVLDDKLPP